MRLLFAGTPEIAGPSLSALAQQHQVVAVLTAEDQPEGRRRLLSPPPIKVLAQQLGLPVLQPAKLDQEVLARIADLVPELMVVFAYGRIFRRDFLAAFPQGAINLHPSALPRYRGPAPLPAALLAGDSDYGITVQRMVRKMDAGEILAQCSFPVEEGETCGSLTAKVAEQAPELLLSVLQRWPQLTGQPQNEREATYCHLIRKEDGMFDWSKPAELLLRQLRAYHPWPGSYSFLPLKGALERCVFHQACLYPREREQDLPRSASPGEILDFDQNFGLLCQTGNGVLGLLRLQRQNRRELPAAEFVLGLPPLKGLSFVGGVGG